MMDMDWNFKLLCLQELAKNNVMISALWWNLFDIYIYNSTKAFWVCVKVSSNDYSTELILT